MLIVKVSTTGELTYSTHPGLLPGREQTSYVTKTHGDSTGFDYVGRTYTGIQFLTYETSSDRFSLKKEYTQPSSKFAIRCAFEDAKHGTFFL